jgi:coenzyme F420 hydrogenase subunit beta
MSPEVEISWELLKIVSDTLDSYKIRAFIDAKKDILDAGIYDEQEYDTILFKMFDEENLKFSLYRFLKEKEETDFSAIKEFSQNNSLEIKKAYALLGLLNAEKLISIEELFEQIPGEGEAPPKSLFKGIKIKILDVDISKVKTIYEPVKTIFHSEVCSGCGICTGICPVDCISVENGFGKVDEDKCIRCGLCYYVCPRTYLPVRTLNMTLDNASELKEYSNIGHFIEAYCARTKVNAIAEVCQDGGISSTCIHYLFEKGLIDCSLGARMSSDPWKPDPLILKSKEDIILTAGTKYVNNPNLSLLNDTYLKDKKIAVVGVPCQMQALLKSEIYNIGFPSVNNVKYRIGIFCMESFPYDGLLKICETLNVNVNDVKKTDINRGKFFIYTKSGEELNLPIKEISHLAREDCELCFDLTSESADIAVGSIGAPSGWNMVLIRTEKGKKLYEELIASDLIESKDVAEVKPGLPMLKKIAGFKRNGCKKHINAKKEATKRIPNY